MSISKSCPTPVRQRTRKPWYGSRRREWPPSRSRTAVARLRRDTPEVEAIGIGITVSEILVGETGTTARLEHVGYPAIVPPAGGCLQRALNGSSIQTGSMLRTRLRLRKLSRNCWVVWV